MYKPDTYLERKIDFQQSDKHENNIKIEEKVEKYFFFLLRNL